MGQKECGEGGMGVWGGRDGSVGREDGEGVWGERMGRECGEGVWGGSEGREGWEEGGVSVGMGVRDKECVEGSVGRE